MSPRAKALPIEAVERWLCQACDKGEPTRLRPDMIEHLASAHDLPRPIHGTRSLVMHLDEGRAFHSTYEWTFEAIGAAMVKAFQYQSGPRR